MKSPTTAEVRAHVATAMRALVGACRDDAAIVAAVPLAAADLCLLDDAGRKQRMDAIGAALFWLGCAQLAGDAEAFRRQRRRLHRILLARLN